MRFPLAFWRLLRVIGHALYAWWVISIRFRRYSQPQRRAWIEQWARRMLTIMGIRLEVRGTPPEHGPALVISNHVSWLDIIALHAARNVRFVSKSGVRHWPLIGTLSTGTGSLYIERERRRDTLRIVHRMAEALREGDLIAVFPEGTIGDGVALLPFHGNLLQAAISADAPIQPVALRYADAASGRTSFAPRYLGPDSLIVSMWRVLMARPLVAHVHFGALQTLQDRSRRTWATALHDEVRALWRVTFPGEGEGDRDSGSR